MGVSRKQSTPSFPKDEHFLSPNKHRHECVSGSNKCSFFGKFGVLCFLETLVLGIGLLPYYRRYLVNWIPLGYWQKEDLHTIINDVDGFCENIAETFKSKFSEQVAERMELIKMKTVTKKDHAKKYISVWTSERDERFSKVSKWQSCG